MHITKLKYTTVLRNLLILAVALILAVPATADGKNRRRSRKSSAPARSMEAVRREQNAAQVKISETSSQLNTTGRELKKQLNRLNTLNADIESSTIHLCRMRTDIDSIGSHISATSDSIAILEKNLETLRSNYVEALRQLQPVTGHISTLSFVFSAKSFSEGWARVRYLRRFSRWREGKVRDIDNAIDRIAERRQHLTGLRHAQDRAYRQAEVARQQLAREHEESKQLVSSLKSRDKELRAELAEQKRRSAALDRELDRLIAEEQARIAREEAERQKKAREAERRRKKSGSSASHGGGSKADTPSARDVASARAEEMVAANNDVSKLSGSFAASKGRLLFPVAGSYKIVRRFGRQPHPTLKHVMTDNAGIDIETAGGTTVRSVYSGTVSAIFKQDGFNTIVMLRHGKYLTVYAGLGSVSVRKGERVKAGESLGTLLSDPSNYGKGILHFEIRDERRKLNPQQWVR
ncbi:MAG: peptidoglycan DD-metalloendopeptidase family protein [Duncaniella sp.]|nr:peptidoglycan DD-metalloendopeptidase family protein [Duncaniella sp.]